MCVCWKRFLLHVCGGISPLGFFTEVLVRKGTHTLMKDIAMARACTHALAVFAAIFQPKMVENTFFEQREREAMCVSVCVSRP